MWLEDKASIQEQQITEDLLKRFGGLRRLYQAHVAEIGSVKGIGPQTAARLKAALALGKRCTSPPLNQGSEERPRINRPADLAWAKRKIRWLFQQFGVTCPEICIER